MKVEFHTADVFTDRRFGGNPLAVVSDARGLHDADMQRVAREFNLSETAFVLPPADPAHTRRVRIFTPGRELPFAGHPTVGTAWVLASIGAVALEGERTDIVFEEGVGPVPVSIFAAGGRPLSATLSVARLPERGPPAPPAAALAEVLSLAPDELRVDGPGASAWSCGVPFLFVPVRDRAVLARARIAMEAWQRHVSGYWAGEIFVFVMNGGGGADAPALSARMFVPGLGIAEDPATGGAAAALAGYLCQDAAGASGTRRWVVEQGVDMGRPSRLEVEADLADGEIRSVRVGGRCVMVSKGEIETDLN